MTRRERKARLHALRQLRRPHSSVDRTIKLSNKFDLSHCKIFTAYNLRSVIQYLAPKSSIVKLQKSFFFRWKYLKSDIKVYILAHILPVYSIKISGRTFEKKKRIEIISGTFGPGSAYIERIIYIYICVINLNYKFIISDILFIVLVPATSSLRKEMPFVVFFFFF